MTNHVKDRHVAAVALKAHASIIVTANLKHFKPKNLLPFGLEAKHPDVFLTELLGWHTHKMLHLLKQQSIGYRKNPIPFDLMLRYLEETVPVFVREIREMLERSPDNPQGY